MTTNGIQKKKSLGQHFLHNQHYLRAVADAAAITPGELVVEVGPGEGTLTRVLLASGARVVAIEKDTRLIPLLRETFKHDIQTGTLSLIEGDALEVETTAFTPEEKAVYKLVGNIPYYITGALLKKFLSETHQPSRIVFLLQKEVAERIAKQKKESIASLSVKVYGSPKYIMTVPKGAFTPPPSVDSAILCISDISKKNFSSEKQEKRFFDLVHAGFSHKRKLLRRNLEDYLPKNNGAMLETIGITEKARAEDIPLAVWVKLSSD